MSKKISIQEKRKWLERFDEGRTEAQIAKEMQRDPRTIVKGLEEAARDRRLASAEAEMLRKALFEHQEYLTGILRDISAMLVLPPDSLAMLEESEGVLAPIPLSGVTVKHPFAEELTLTIHAEDRLEWELTQEHLKEDKLWGSLRQWRKAMIDHIRARWQFKLATKSRLVEATDLRFAARKDDGQSEYLLPECTRLLFEVAMKAVLGIPDGTDLANGIVACEDKFVRHGVGGTEMARCNKTVECKDRIVSVSASLPSSVEALRVKNTHKELAAITRSAKRQTDEILLLGMVTGKCRVCRRLGR